jgi:hypothetical protein
MNVSSTVRSSCTLGEGMRAAIDEIKGGYQEMIDGWRRT